jgi:hypothetical protein
MVLLAPRVATSAVVIRVDMAVAAAAAKFQHF